MDAETYDLPIMSSLHAFLANNA